MIAGTQVPAGLGASTVLPDMDFETYSEAGFLWNDKTQKWVTPAGANKKGLAVVGAVAYTEHPSAEVISLAYDLKDGLGTRLWLPGMEPPADLFQHIQTGGLIEAWNCGFEFWVWKNVCFARMGWPELPFWQLRDAAAKSRAFALPGSLEKAGAAVGSEIQKDKEGDRLIRKFCVPRNPTKSNPATRISPTEDLADAQKFFEYNMTDIRAEASISALCPDLSPEENEFHLCTQAANVRGTGLDLKTINAGIRILDQALEQYDDELHTLTDGAVEKASQVSRLSKWLEGHGVFTRSLDADAIESILARDVPDVVARALRIRQLVGSAGVKKLYAMQRMASKAGRAHDMFIYHGARTGRDTGKDIQPQNLVKQGPELFWCSVCGKSYGTHRDDCPYCQATAPAKREPWGWAAVDQAAEEIQKASLPHLENIYGDAVLTLSGCIRGMFVPAAGHDFLCSDYSSIEAVVTAMLAGEQWRIETFQRKEDIYLISASRITGTPVEEYLSHPNGPKGHPDRQKIGKVAELALGFGGWINAWLQFDKSGSFSDEEIKRTIMAWRDASPGIVEMWGGQVRGKPWAPERNELYGFEGMAIAAVSNPGHFYQYGSVGYIQQGDVLYCRLPSGRYLTYHRPRLSPSSRWEGQVSLSFEGYNSNPQMGPTGWIRIDTFGGRLAENVVQATARDVLRDAVVRLERAGYPHVLRVHDEIICEVPEGYGSIEEMERLMSIMPEWAADWPVRAEGGWRGKRFRKD